MTEFLLIVGMAAVTYGIRYPIIALLGRITIPAAFFAMLRFVPPAVLSAIIVPALVLPDGVFDLSLANNRLLAGLLAILVAWRTQNLLLTILIGLVGLWMLQRIA